MAENLSKNKLLLDQKKGKKKLYKSWKLYAITLGIIGVGLGIGLGVGLGVNANKVPDEITITDQDIAKAINNASYTTETIMNSSAQSITNQITGDFIKTKLTSKFEKTFNTESFKLNKITVGNNNTELNDNDLSVIQTINAKINYNYGSINNQESNLTITIKTSDQQIVDAINKVSTYTLAATTNDEATNITNQLNSTFIKTQLSDEIVSAFNPELFKFNKVTINGTDLQDSDLTTEQTINTKINYNYDTIINQETNLIITIKTSDQQIVNEINNASYSIKTIMNSSASSVTDQINSEFIQTQLTNEFGKAFNSDLFKFNKITVDGNNLQDSDLTISGTINAKINYNYDTIINQETNLIVTVSLNEQQIVDAINVTTYNLFATIDDTAQSITNQLDDTFIKSELSDEIANIFNFELFDLNSITIGDNTLVDNDLTIATTLNAKINYNYDSITNQSTNLTIIVTTSDEQIVNQINNNTNYLLTVLNGTNAQSITNQINNTKFIKQQLAGNSRKSFNNDSFTLNNITINNRVLTDNDLQNSTIVNAKINYNYGTMTKVETNLTISLISSVLDPDVINTIKNITYEIKTTKGNTAKNITNQINAEFIQEELMGEIATKFNSDKFKFNKIVFNGNDLQDSNLATIGIVNAKINFSYNSSIYETNLTIIIE